MPWKHGAGSRNAGIGGLGGGSSDSWASGRDPDPRVQARFGGAWAGRRVFSWRRLGDRQSGDARCAVPGDRAAIRCGGGVGGLPLSARAQVSCVLGRQLCGDGLGGAERGAAGDRSPEIVCRGRQRRRESRGGGRAQEPRRKRSCDRAAGAGLSGYGSFVVRYGLVSGVRRGSLSHTGADGLVPRSLSGECRGRTESARVAAIGARFARLASGAGDH